jgi:hypothetical protein
MLRIWPLAVPGRRRADRKRHDLRNRFVVVSDGFSMSSENRAFASAMLSCGIVI